MSLVAAQPAPRASASHELAAQVVACEHPFAANAYRGTGPRGGLARVAGRGVLLSAPHAVHHRRDGRVKWAETMTGGLAMAVARSTDAAALAAQGGPYRDPAMHDDAPYKRALLELAEAGDCRVVIDLHGMTDAHGPDLCFGRGPMPRRDLLQLAGDLADQYGLFYAVDVPFNARRPTTVTAFAQRHGLIAMQVEVARRLRPLEPDERSAQLAAWLQELVLAAVETCRPRPVKGLEQLLRLTEAAELLGISRQQLLTLHRLDLVPWLNRPDFGPFAFDQDALEAWRPQLPSALAEAEHILRPAGGPEPRP